MNRPVCEVPGCGKLAHNVGHGRYRKASWVREEFGVENGWVCGKHHFKNYGIGGWIYKQFRKAFCENIDGRLGFKCTTTIIDPEWQLDADHKDGNPSNNVKENIQTLCKCCHVIKTKINMDYATAGRKTLQVA